MLKIEKLPISEIKENKKNPRTITEAQLDKLAKSLEAFPQMFEVRPIVVDKTGKIIGGNMRFAAAKKIGLTEVPVIRAESLTDEQIAEFIIKDNLPYGEWDIAELKGWDTEKLSEWGLDIFPDSDDEKYTKKVVAPEYIPQNEKPTLFDLVDNSKSIELIQKINESDVSSEEKEFLVMAASRHCVFNYEKIADYYAHSAVPVQRLMEQSALIIIDFNQAISGGFVKLSEELRRQYIEENPIDGQAGN